MLESSYAWKKRIAHSVKNRQAHPNNTINDPKKVLLSI